MDYLSEASEAQVPEWIFNLPSLALSGDYPKPNGQTVSWSNGDIHFDIEDDPHEQLIFESMVTPAERHFTFRSWDFLALDNQQVRTSEQLRFQELTRQWQIECGSSSSLTWITSRPSYLQIIAMGEMAIPFILEELHNRPDHWSTALSAITNDNPIPQEHRGNLRAMAEDWISWGKENGYNDG